MGGFALLGDAASGQNGVSPTCRTCSAERRGFVIVVSAEPALCGRRVTYKLRGVESWHATLFAKPISSVHPLSGKLLVTKIRQLVFSSSSSFDLAGWMLKGLSDAVALPTAASSSDCFQVQQRRVEAPARFREISQGLWLACGKGGYGRIERTASRVCRRDASVRRIDNP